MMGQKASGSGALLVGTRGTYFSGSDYGERNVLLPQANFQGYQPPAPTLPRSPGHHQEWILACKGGPKPMSNFVDHACPLTETVLLGNVAIRTGRRIMWDSANLRAVGMPEADPLIRREYRKGWVLEGASEIRLASATTQTPGTQRPTTTQGQTQNPPIEIQSEPPRGLLRRLFRRRFFGG
jgi:hypothetical protein